MTYSEYYEQWKKQKNGNNAQEVSTTQNSSNVNIKKNTATPQTTYSDYYKQWKERWTKSRAQEEEKARKLAPVKNVVNRFLNAGESASEGIKQGTLNRITDVTNRGKYIGKNLEVGTLQGTAGIPQAILTESANEMRKGQEKDANGILNQIGKAIVNNRANNVIDDTIRITKSDLDTIKNKDKNLWKKLVGITTNHVSESAKMVTPGYSTFSALNQATGKIAPQASDIALDINQKISAPIKYLQQQLAEEGQNYDGVTRTLGEGANVIGNMAPSIATSAITKNPEMALGVMGLSAKGQSTKEALDKGANLDEAVKIGDTKGLVEVGTELATGGAKIFGGGTTAEQALRKQIKDKVGSKVLQAVANTGLDIAGEGLEETVSDIVDTAIDKGTTDPNASYSLKDWGKTQGITALTTLALNGLGIGGNAITQRINNIATAPIQQTQNQPTAPVNTLNQQQNQTVQNRNMEQIKIDSENFSRQIDDVKNGTFPQKDMLTLGKTPQALIDIGLPDLPITMTQRHLDTIMNESGKYKNANYHGLGEEIVKQLPEAINNPLDIVKSNTKDDSVVLTTYLADKQGRPVIASIKIDGTGRVNDIMIDTNVMTSAYGRNNYDKFMQDNIKNGNLLYDIDRGVIKKVTGARLQLPRTSNFSTNDGSFVNNSIPQNTDNVNNTTINNNYAQNIQNDTQIQENKTLNPTEISNMKLEDVNTTPVLPKKYYNRGNKESSFYSNITQDSKFLNEELRKEMSNEESIRYYNGITNAETLEKAYNSLSRDGKNATLNWFNKDSKNANAEDIAKGWILLKQYQDAGNYQSAVEVAKKMRDTLSTAGQTVQAANILSRLTPEGMFYYAQSELSEAYNKAVEGKSKKWIDENADKFNLTPQETQTIMDTMKEVSTMEDGREKKIKLAEIQKLVSDKIPPTAGQSIKAWMRISMLLNPKTLNRNFLGNAVVLPVNVGSDFISSGVDKMIAKKTGVRTTGNINVKNYAKGFGKGLFESYDDFRRGINTREIQGNKFEIGEGKSFNDKGIGEALNRLDNVLNFALDAGDRPFYEATFTNSINNQLVLNNTTEVTQDMIDIATNEALQRTWQDDNAYTKTVLDIRKNLNKLNVKGYGLGDVLIPFAKTPANLTKAIVDYSPVGLTKALTLDAKKFTNSLNNGQYSPQLQHKFVQSLGKGMAGSLLYVLGYGLAKSGIASGESDDDKDVKNFMKNSLGISSYSIKIGDKSFTYDWAQPVAVPLAIMTNYVKYSKDNPDAKAIDKAIKSMNIGTEQLLEQSFMESLNTVFNGNGTFLENLSKAVMDLPARAIPTFSKQIADMVDGTQRTSFEYGAPVKSAINSAKSKIPFVSKTLPIARDTFGNEIQKYGGENNLWNVMLNPANVNKGKLSKAGKEIYELYKETGEKNVFPVTAPYYINSKGEKVNMTAEQRSEYQKVTGKYTEKVIKGLLADSDYKKLSNEKKAKLISEIISDSNAKAKYDVLKIDTDDYAKLRKTLQNIDTTTYYDYKFKTKDMKKDIEKTETLINSNYNNKEKSYIYENYIKSKDKEDTISTYDIMKKAGLNINEWLKYEQQEFENDKKDDGTLKGKSVKNSGKEKMINYINSTNMTYEQKLLLTGTGYTLSNSERRTLINYVNNMDTDYSTKIKIFSKIKGITVYKNGQLKLSK